MTTVPIGFKNRLAALIRGRFPGTGGGRGISAANPLPTAAGQPAASARRGLNWRMLPLFTLALTLAGCVWLHVLELKNQITEFDTNFSVKVTDHFTVYFLNPVLHADDYFTLAKVEPTKKATTPEGSRWTQVFTKLDAAGKAETKKTVVFTFDFNKEDLLAKWDFSPAFLVFMPPKFLEAAIRSLGKSKVNTDERHVQVAPEDLPKVRAEQPTREKIYATLGQPSEITQEDGMTMEVYRFRTETTYVKEEYQTRHQAYANMYYEPGGDIVEKVNARFLGLKFAVDFRNFIELRAAGKSN
ncbi:hypothetical protein F6R98_12015 [Candidatus Methylospira mobilis]|uniref:Uncharacterized protein n=1 Tax=Candidatus Methylospira mobilis TaxID=1808979 RepID=A0A5Q0BMC7_9GAMM|nr:hypothetical protein [Candidatus Methylospira mobilis]QFY43257.1 hypothetical protein F6R98_12015 [Candidatus Methylospira mobilis]